MRALWWSGLAFAILVGRPEAAVASPLDGLLEQVAAAASAEQRAAGPQAPSNRSEVADATPEEALEQRDLAALSAMLDRHEAEAARLAAAKRISLKP